MRPPERGRPPRFWSWLISVATDPDDRRFVLSDLAEELELRSGRSRMRARWWYRGQVLRSLGPALIWRLRRAGPPDLGDAFQDLRHGVRRLVRSPLMAVSIVLSLGLGIGAVTAVFMVGNAFLFGSSDAVSDEDSLVSVFTSEPSGRAFGESSYPDFVSLASNVEAFENVAAFRPGVVRRSDEGADERLLLEIVTPEFFSVLGTRFPIGRPFTAAEGRLGAAEPLVVISHEYWIERFGGLTDAIGATMRLDEREFTVIGVAPEGLLGRFLRVRVDAWVPVGLAGGIYHITEEEWTDRRDRDYGVIARLAHGATLEQAATEAAVLQEQLRDSYPDSWAEPGTAPRAFTIVEERQARLPPDGRAALMGFTVFMILGTSLVLLIACSNVAGLFLSRSERRSQELAVRAALGAGRGRLVRLLFVESLVLAGAGGVLGLYLMGFVTLLFRRMPLPLDIPLRFDVPVDARVIAFSLVLSFATSLFFGLMPAWRSSRVDLAPALRGLARDGRRRGSRLRRSLVVVQVAGSVVMVLLAGLFLRSLAAARVMDVGMDADGVSVASAQVSHELSGPDARAVLADLVKRIEADPAVVSAALAITVEGSLWEESMESTLRLDGVDVADGLGAVPFNAVDGSYFDVIGLRVLRGRSIRDRDAAGPAVAVVNQAFAERYWSGEDPLGQWFTVEGYRLFGAPGPVEAVAYQVVGIAQNFGLVESGGAHGPFYWVHADRVEATHAMIVAKGRTAAETLTVLRAEVADYAETLTMVPPQTYAEMLETRLSFNRITSRVLALAGLFTLLLTVVGIYGVVSLAITQRTREIAIRRAVGARAAQVVNRVVGEGIRLAAIGVLVGLAIAVPAALALRSSLIGVSPLDPVAVASSISVLVAVAWAAAFVPALRASRVHPMTTLREE